MVDRAEEEPARQAPLEPRYFARLAIELDVVVEVDGQELSGRSVDLSEGGLAVRLQTGPLGGSALRLTFTLPGASRPIRTAGTVVRSNARADGTHELAVAFELGDEEASVVRALVAERGGIAWEATESAFPRERALHFIPLIRRIARTLGQRLPPNVAVDDLVGAAFVALVELQREHRTLSLEAFEALALPRLRFAMLDELRDQDPLSRRVRMTAGKIDKTRARLELARGRAVARAEIAEALGMTEANVEDAQRLADQASSAALASLDDLDPPDSARRGPEERATRAQSLERLSTALGAIPPRHKKILELYYGEDLTLRQIGNVLGVTEARISQLLSDAVKKLRNTMKEP